MLVVQEFAADRFEQEEQFGPRTSLSRVPKKAKREPHRFNYRQGPQRVVKEVEFEFLCGSGFSER